MSNLTVSSSSNGFYRIIECMGDILLSGVGKIKTVFDGILGFIQATFSGTLDWLDPSRVSIPTNKELLAALQAQTAQPSVDLKDIVESAFQKVIGAVRFGEAAKEKYEPSSQKSQIEQQAQLDRQPPALSIERLQESLRERDLKIEDLNKQLDNLGEKNADTQEALKVIAQEKALALAENLKIMQECNHLKAELHAILAAQRSESKAES
jgi:hypothetical protein